MGLQPGRRRSSRGYAGATSGSLTWLKGDNELEQQGDGQFRQLYDLAAGGDVGWRPGWDHDLDGNVDRQHRGHGVPLLHGDLHAAGLSQLYRFDTLSDF